MKHLLSALLLLATCWSCSKDHSPNRKGSEDTTQFKNYYKDLIIVNWNIEWFGSARFPGSLAAQESNAGKILRYLDADLYGICEVVDTARFGRMIRNYMGSEFNYIISPYPKIDQKLAFVYNRHIFRNVRARPFMSQSATAAVSFASGRFPFLLSADMVVNGKWHPVHFILLHAKADAAADAYARRKEGSVELKDSLDVYFNGQHCMVFGDFNDQLNGSILNGYLSPYKNFLEDGGRYQALTLPLNTTGYQSTLSFSNSVIDQQLVSGNLRYWYKDQSVSIRTDVKNVVPDYEQRTTSDHYPVTSAYAVTD
ncbi:endonuclease/exonuclease/phosphatase [Niabella sp. CC-SYL272]|uniref:endonuclease/exonuclease/phosphatase family protein n=1 Tax=Niabella agricola TaxID=2891571 RepID=UPI001F1A3763|nr:endonuclease/exonuclease/phosphatase family protein [Niabella agricola]MCF3112213.1 endonuclease/exonuclease/phosphatase [Niabella agricola]